MKTRLLVLFASLLSLLLMAPSGCGPQPAPNPPPQPVAQGGTLGAGGSVGLGGTPAEGGATAQSKCQLACANLAALGCPEDQTTCVNQCEILTHDNRFTFDADCRINAKTKTAAQACGVGSCK